MILRLNLTRMRVFDDFGVSCRLKGLEFLTP
jgi:hypothetical protein